MCVRVLFVCKPIAIMYHFGSSPPLAQEGLIILLLCTPCGGRYRRSVDMAAGRLPATTSVHLQELLQVWEIESAVDMITANGYDGFKEALVCKPPGAPAGHHAQNTVHRLEVHRRRPPRAYAGHHAHHLCIGWRSIADGLRERLLGTMVVICASPGAPSPTASASSSRTQRS